MYIYLGAIGSLLGLCVSLYIYQQKRKKKTLICPREGNCEKVVHSTYATTLGINNEILGIVYYVLQGGLWVGMLLWSAPLLYVSISLLTFGGTVFSLYLIWVQATVLRAWCLWCLGSVGAQTLLIVATFLLLS